MGCQALVKTAFARAVGGPLSGIIYFGRSSLTGVLAGLSKEEVMPKSEAQLRQQMRNYAVELRQVAYTLPNGVGEHDLLRLSDQMRAAADQVVGNRAS